MLLGLQLDHLGLHALVLVQEPQCALVRCGEVLVGMLCDPEATAKSGDAVPYAAAKLAGEQLGRTLSDLHGQLQRQRGSDRTRRVGEATRQA